VASSTISTIDPGKEAIKEWLKAKSVNKQQLRNVRRGTVKAIKDGYLLDMMTRLHTAKPTRILRWAQTRLDTIPPVQLEGIDDFEGLLVQRNIGPLAYVLHDFADANGWAEQQLRSQLLSHEVFPHMLFRASVYREHTRSKLEDQLGMAVEEFAFSLLILATFLGNCPVDLPPSIGREIIGERHLPRKYPERLENERPKLTSGQTNTIRRFFEDCFKLRENIFDGELLSTMIDTLSLKASFELVAHIECKNISEDFLINDEPLGSFIGAIQDRIATLVRLQTNPHVKSLFISLYGSNIEVDTLPEFLVAILPNDHTIERGIVDFVQSCHPCDLHQALIESAVIEAALYQQSLSQLQRVLAELEIPHESILTEKTNTSKSFTKAEAEALVKFEQQGFRMPIHHLEEGFLTKIAQQIPDLYKRLELRLQRG
jgi:hypothetical protein